MSELETSQQPPLPDHDLWSHLRDMNPESYEFKEELSITNELALEAGLRAVELSDIFVDETVIPPEGFTREVITARGARIPTQQFEGTIHSLAESVGAEIKTDVRTLVNDSGKAVRLVDLRTQMTNNVRKGGPETESAKKKLDEAMYKDLRFFLDNGHGKNSVRSAKGVYYTKRGSSKERAYWMVVNDQLAEGTTTIARIADSKDSIAAEAALYSTVFHKTL